VERSDYLGQEAFMSFVVEENSKNWIVDCQVAPGLPILVLCPISRRLLLGSK